MHESRWRKAYVYSGTGVTPEGAKILHKPVESLREFLILSFYLNGVIFKSKMSGLFPLDFTEDLSGYGAFS